MKDFFYQDSVATRLAAIRGLFKTDPYKRTEIAKVILSAATRVILFAREYTDIQVEWGMHPAWVSVVPLRDKGFYTNYHIHDLYLVHELFHIANRVSGFASVNSWVNNKLHEEFEAALFSEMSVYDHVPGLRKDRFPFPILYDEARAISDTARLDHYRRAVIVTGAQDTPASLLMQKYQSLNRKWVYIFGEIAEEVEKHMQAVDLGLVTPKDHLEWLKTKMTDDVFFRPQAEEFSVFQKAIKA